MYKNACLSSHDVHVHAHIVDTMAVKILPFSNPLIRNRNTTQDQIYTNYKSAMNTLHIHCRHHDNRELS